MKMLKACVEEMSVMPGTSANSVMSSLPVRPFEEGTNPQDCTGYPMPMFFEGNPKLELDFYLECDDDIFRGKANEVQVEIEMRNENDEKSTSTVTKSTILEQGQDFTIKTFKEAEAGKKEKEALIRNQNIKEKIVDSQQKKSLACTLIPSPPTSPPTSTSTSTKETQIRPKSRERKNTSMTSLQTQLSNLDRTKPVIILCHGMISWRNQWLIANICSQLSKSLSCHTLRFDFTGCGHSSGEWKYGDYELDHVDLRHVVDFVQRDLQCEVACIVGHSQGSAAVLRHAYEHTNSNANMRNNAYNQNLQASPPLYVNLAGRCFGANEVDYKKKFSKEQCQELETQGRFTIVRRGPNRKFDIAADAIVDRNRYDVTYYAKGINANANANAASNSNSTSTSTSSQSKTQVRVRVLTIHGDGDKTVPVENAYMFKQLLSPKECHEMCIVDEADHNFSGIHRIHEVVTSIAAFVKKHRRGGGGGSGSGSGMQTSAKVKVKAGLSIPW